ncbi:hypothetical protein T484DRAFT_1826158 [Baffinella frigidus]|nr:hypothetical protein T484DRAFT_1826158 [Cryptophyta sp. CCMP2293]
MSIDGASISGAFGGLRDKLDADQDALKIYRKRLIYCRGVIDAFGGLRDKLDADQDALKTNCFVCHLDRTSLDNSGPGFDKHVLKEHNPEHYFLFLLRLKQHVLKEHNPEHFFLFLLRLTHVGSRARASLSGQELYILHHVWPDEAGRSVSVEWLPRETTHSLAEMLKEQQEGEAEDQSVTQRIFALEQKMHEGFAEQRSVMTRLEELLLAQVSFPKIAMHPKRRPAGH